MNLADLKAPFAPSKISWRVGSTTQDKSKGMALAYIDARDVQDRLDEVCGVAGWQCRYVPMHDKKTVCEVGILVHRIPMGGKPGYDEWVWKSDGAGDSDIEAEKGALSDAFKRAAVRWGIGRYLYDLESPWVAITAAGRSFKIADHEYKRLEALLEGKQKPAQRDAIHGASTLKAPIATEAYAPPPVENPATMLKTTSEKADAAKRWALGEIPRIKTMPKLTLDNFYIRFKKAREELKALDPKTSLELEKALSDRLEALFA